MLFRAVCFHAARWTRDVWLRHNVDPGCYAKGTSWLENRQHLRLGLQPGCANRRHTGVEWRVYEAKGTRGWDEEGKRRGGGGGGGFVEQWHMSSAQFHRTERPTTPPVITRLRVPRLLALSRWDWPISPAPVIPCSFPSPDRPRHRRRTHELNGNR